MACACVRIMCHGVELNITSTPEACVKEAVIMEEYDQEREESMSEAGEGEQIPLYLRLRYAHAFDLELKKAQVS